MYYYSSQISCVEPFILKMTQKILYIILGFSLLTSTWGSPAQLSLCQTCHGTNGYAQQNAWPNLAGQSAKYMVKQLQDLKNNARQSPLMQAYAKLLSEQEMIEISDYYAKQSRHPAQNIPNPRGEQLYLRGDATLRVPACSACHGPSGLGNDAAKYPALAQQNALYIQQQLLAFKTHARQNDPHHIMQDISERLSSEDIVALSQYLSLL
jgi:cytochrome c553